VRVTADRGFADVALFTRLTDLRVACVIRVKKRTKIYIAGVWRTLDTLRFAGNTRRVGDSKGRRASVEHRSTGGLQQGRP
jgi:hypothetical protein